MNLIHVPGIHILRGGYFLCYHRNCCARRNPSTGRFEAHGNHYHPIEQKKLIYETLTGATMPETR